ncbi:hypothetical protein [Marinobacter pelagius]|uniref:Uncharacterized protein n=1 Tax=Marinobacter pelagius TaxID=379482 RepID=A0A1I4T4S4_9GAMM|nr:hypothetical protein [Marinobacter pelagius]SFM71613.1 hypothetical protein SAMN04487961_0997 [Marinobacter pelagius]
MSAKYLAPDVGDRQFLDNNAIARQRFNHKETVNGTSDWIVIPPGPDEFTVSVDPSAGTARVEYTQDTIQEAEAGTATSQPWPDGDVSTYADGVMANSVTAVRCVSTADTNFRVTM